MGQWEPHAGIRWQRGHTEALCSKDGTAASYRASICPCVHKKKKKKTLRCLTKRLITIRDRLRGGLELPGKRSICSVLVCFCMAPPWGSVISAHQQNPGLTLSQRSRHFTETLWRTGLLSVLRSTPSSSRSGLEHGAVPSGSLRGGRLSRARHRFPAALNWGSHQSRHT